MKKLFRNKKNIFLLFLLTIAGATLMILNVEATDSYTIEGETEDSPLLVQKSKFLLSGSDEDAVPTDHKYVLRATDENPMGYVDSTFIRCFMQMGPVEFGPRYKFKSQESNDKLHRFYGFTIPLVGDLNGDGKPEIVGLGVIDGAGGLTHKARYIYILNGQTGHEIVRFTLPMDFALPGLGYHGSPCQLAIVDSDRNGKGEIILAFGNGGSNDWSKRVVSWEVNDRTFDSSYSATDNSKLTMKWKTQDRYDRYGSGQSIASSVFGKPIPQVVDIDSDGVPEVIVYNKIYNAVTGDLIMKIEDLASTVAGASFFFGSDRKMLFSDNQIGFPFIYDIDFDGKYDIIAGGKVYYDINLRTKTYKTITCPGIGDGHTGVADINADGLPEIVTLQYTDRGTGKMRLSVWSPNLVKKDEGGRIVPGSGIPTILAERDIQQSYEDTGNHSYLFIGDIDGREQNGKKMPEISILSSRMFVPSYGTYNKATIPVHPNVSGLLQSDFGFSPGVEGLIVGLTWDDNNVGYKDKLKVSFVMEHADRSSNTGFTLFDFDNDGIQDICYRDEKTLRIISASKPYVTLNETDPSVIRFREKVHSYTGYEYPVIADIDGDASADMIVMGHEGAAGEAWGYVYAVEGKNGDLSPAPKVWNQYFYSPLKINEDLTTPKKLFHPLDDRFYYKERETDTQKTYIYNNTINQTTIYSVTENGVIQPVVRIPDAKLLDLAIDMSAKRLNFKLTNLGDATLNSAIPINIYMNGTYSPSLSTTVGSGGLFPGNTLSYSIPITDNLAVYTVVIGATIDSNKNLTPVGSYTDCNWADNIDEVASFFPKNDAATVVQYGTTVIDVLANDVLTSECSTQVLTSAKIRTPGGQGIMSGSFGSVQIVNNKLLYTAPQSYPNNNVVELTYTLTCGGTERSATVYIYIIESCDFGFASCAGSPYSVCVKKIPSDISFEWYNDADYYIGESSPTIPNLITDVVFYAKPNFSQATGAAEKYKAVEFPKGKVAIKALSSAEHLKAKWTGEVDTDWYNPTNWVQVLTNGSEMPITWSPVSCVDVTISAGAKYYPELKSAVSCGKIHLEDRAMISGIHYLTYTEASVDFKPVASEKDRFVMWSAPLKNMYTGDYHFVDNSGQPNWGHVLMNLFQSGNPDYTGSVATEKTFTATFGSTGTNLSLGTAFNVKVMSGKDAGFSFPKSATSYADANGQGSGTLVRTNAKRFITDGALNTNGYLTLPVNGNNQFMLMQVVNPFMAYLNMNAFLSANSTSISGSYKIWNGDVNADFISVLAYEDNEEMRYVIDDEKMTVSTAPYIAPLQSFFVTKRSAGPVTSLTMNSASMTATAYPGSEESYVLRSAARGDDQKNLLRVKATSGNAENSTVLLRRTGAQQEFDSSEDAEKFFNHGTPISVYSLTKTKKAVAINVSDNFSGDVKLGLRVRNTNSPVTLSFSGLSSFGQGVKLIDHALGNKEIDIQKESYSFTVDAQGSKDVVELNDRFSLRFVENPTGIDEIEDNNINIVGGNSRIEVSSGSIFNRVEVISLSGMKIHDNTIPVSFCQLPVPGNQVYLVSVTVGNKQIVKKIYVK